MITLSETTPSPEIQLLLYCARTKIDLATVEAIKNLLQQPINWIELIKLANQHKVLPLVAQSLKDNFTDTLPQDILKQLQSFFSSNLRRNLLLTSELLKLLDLFKQQQIPTIPFKGPILTNEAYGNLALREILDLDLLVRETDFIKATELLISQGYWLRSQLSWEHHFECNDLYTVDLHRDAIPKHLSCFPNSNYLWEHLTTFSLAGVQGTTFSLETSLIILCLNGTKECWRSLNRICDVAELVSSHPDLDWQKLVTQIQKLRCKRLVLIGLILASELFNTRLPEIIEQEIAKERKATAIADKVEKRLFAQNISTVGKIKIALFCISTREHWQDKIQSFIDLINYLGWMNITEHDREFINLPAFLNILYYLIRPLRIIGKYSIILSKQLLQK